MKVEEIAKVAHEINRAYCRALGDYTQPVWELAPDWQRNSAIAGVEFCLANPEAGPQISHINWVNQKLKDGWKWGPVKDPEKKEHPCIAPYEDLPIEQRAKDYLFRATVNCLKDTASVLSVMRDVEIQANTTINLLKEIDALKEAKNGAYWERNYVVAALAQILSRKIFRDTDVGIAQHDPNDANWDSDWRTILVINLPTGQLTWHFHDSEKYLLEGLPEIKDYKWDGHTSEEKYKRLLDFLS